MTTLIKAVKATTLVTWSQAKQDGNQGARFSKVPKLVGRISVDIVLFVSSKRRRLKARNFAVTFKFFSPLQHMKRPDLQNERVGVLGTAFRAQNVSRLSRNGPQALSF